MITEEEEEKLHLQIYELEAQLPTVRQAQEIKKAIQLRIASLKRDFPSGEANSQIRGLYDILELCDLWGAKE